MKLSDIKKNADAKAAEVEAARKHAQLMAELDVHPLLKWGCARDVRDAYFFGVVFAALTDDVEIDENERKACERIGRSLALSGDEIEELTSSVTKTVKAAVETVDLATGAGGDEVFAVLEECAVSLADDKIFRMFLAEYVKVCGTKKFDAKDVKEQLSVHVASKFGRDLNQFIDEGLFDALCRVVQSGRDFNRDDLLELSDWLGEDAMRYLMLDVFEDDVKPILDAHRTMLANRAALPAKLAAIIEGDGTWPVEFCPMDYADMFADAGVTDVNTYLVDAMLPKMKEAYGLAKVKIHDTKIRNDINEWPFLGVIFESTYEFRKLFRYAFFFDAYLDLIKLSKEYYFCGPPEDADDYCRSRRYADSKDLSFARRSKVESGFGSLTIIKALDRLRCTQAGYTAGMKNVAEYFERWERLFVAIAKEVC